MITYQNKYVIKTVSLIPGQIDMIANPDGVSFSSLPPITGSKTIKADMFIKNNTAFFIMFFSDGATNDYLIYYYGNTEFGKRFSVEVKNGAAFRNVFDIEAAGLLNTVFSLEIIKGTGSITSVKFNGNTLTNLGGFVSQGPSNQQKFYGSDHVSIWNLEIVGQNKWIGYPYGNTNGAWVDTIGSINGTISGTPGTVNLI